MGPASASISGAYFYPHGRATAVRFPRLATPAKFQEKVLKSLSRYTSRLATAGMSKCSPVDSIMGLYLMIDVISRREHSRYSTWDICMPRYRASMADAMPLIFPAMRHRVNGLISMTMLHARGITGGRSCRHALATHAGAKGDMARV